MEKKLILRGALAGTIAGMLAFVFARIFAEPVINAAISYESGRDAMIAALDKAAGVVPPAPGPDIFSRTIQASVGVGVGMIAFGAAMGALFAVTYALCLGRVGNVRPRTLALLVAAGGFVAIYLVPYIKYPANPPSIGHPETIRQRGGYYLLMVLASVLLLGKIVYAGFPADVLFSFRLYSVAAQLLLWSAIGLIFAPLADRLLAPGPARAELRRVPESTAA